VFFVSVSDVYCKSFRHMLQVFHLNVAKVGTMLHMLRWDPLAITTCLAARALPSGCRHSGEGSCQAPNFGSFVHYVSVPGSVVDTHNSNKIDIKKNHTFIAIGETHYRVHVYIAWVIGLIVDIRVLRQWSYIIVAPFLQAT
jgi:hypothetical protein